MRVRDDHDHGEPQLGAGRECRTHSPARGVGIKTAILTVTVTAVLTASVLFLGRWLLLGDRSVAAASNKGVEPPTGVPLFQGWGKPDVALLLTAQQHGYLLPCGCSSPQKGGLERRYNFVQTLTKDLGWPLVPVDLGDIAQLHGPQSLPNVQGLIKYRYSIEALNLMGYVGLGVGEHEAALPLTQALDNLAVMPQAPRVLAANIKDRDNKFPGEVDAWRVVPVAGTSWKVAVVGVIGHQVAQEIGRDPQVQFDEVSAVLPGVLRELAPQKPDLKVLLYQGAADKAKLCAKAFPQFQVILCLSDDDEGSSRPDMVGSTLVIGVGHKGKNVGVVGAFHTDNPQQPFTLRYQMVTLSEEYKTPPGQQSGHPIERLMERYTQELKDGGYLQKYGQGNHALQVAVPNVVPTYVGSQKCKKCHEHAFEVWEGSKHSHAYQTLVDARHPSLRQYDGECIVCHVTGFAYKGGFTDAVKTAHLKDVGCESCHGPCSEHARHPNDEKWHDLINPWKAKENETEADKHKRTLLIDQACQKCHDSDNDVHWDFQKNWPQIAHPSPGT